MGEQVVYQRILQVVALAVLSLIAFLAKPLPTTYAQSYNPGHIRFTLTEAGLVISWDAMDPEGFTHYIVDIYAGTDLDSNSILWCIEVFDSTTTTLPASEFPGLSAIWVFVNGYYEDPQAGTRYDDFFYFVGNEALNRGGGGVGYVSNLDFFLLGAIGKAYLVSDNRIDLYEIIEGSNEGFFSLRITQKEVDKALAAAGEATCVKASANDRASVTVWADGNVTLSIGPDYETKIFHVLLEGGLGGKIIGTTTTYGPPAGAHCPN